MTEVSGKPVVGHLLDRLAACPGVDQVAIATSTKPEDDEIERYGRAAGAGVYRGDPEDVLARITGAAEHFDADAVAEVGGDCPFVDPPLVERAISEYLESGADVASNALVEPFTYPVGYELVVASVDALRSARADATLTSERHQPFQYHVKHPERFRIQAFAQEGSLNHWRWTLDYPEDLKLVRAVYGELYDEDPLFGLERIEVLLSQKPQLARINSSRAEPVSVATVWYTGSFVREAHVDIERLLGQARDAEERRDHAAAVDSYRQATELLDELIRRGEHLGSEAAKPEAASP